MCNFTNMWWSGGISSTSLPRLTSLSPDSCPPPGPPAVLPVPAARAAGGRQDGARLPAHHRQRRPAPHRAGQAQHGPAGRRQGQGRQVHQGQRQGGGEGAALEAVCDELCGFSH